MRTKLIIPATLSVVVAGCAPPLAECDNNNSNPPNACDLTAIQASGSFSVCNHYFAPRCIVMEGSRYISYPNTSAPAGATCLTPPSQCLI